MSLDLALLFIFHFAPIEFLFRNRENLPHGFLKFYRRSLNLVSGCRHVAQYAIEQSDAITPTWMEFKNYVPNEIDAKMRRLILALPYCLSPQQEKEILLPYFPEAFGELLHKPSPTADGILPNLDLGATRDCRPQHLERRCVLVSFCALVVLFLTVHQLFRSYQFSYAACHAPDVSGGSESPSS